VAGARESPAPEGAAAAPAPRRPTGKAALGFALAAVAASWNVMAAPLGLVVGIGAAALASRALRRSPRKRVPGLALALALFAVIASAAVLAVTAGAVGTELPGEPVLEARSPQELKRVLDEAGQRTRAERERARGELDRLGGAGQGGSGAPPGGRK
jgi:hypothetical protein